MAYLNKYGLDYYNTLTYDQILSNIASIEWTTIASQAYVIGDYLIYRGQLYKVIQEIEENGTIIIEGNNKNCIAVNIVDEVNNIIDMNLTNFSIDINNKIDTISNTIKVTDLHINRYGRFLDNFAEEGRSRILYSQGVCYYKIPESSEYYYYTCGSYSSNSNQSICQIDSTGSIVNSEQFTELGHANDITIANDYLLIADGNAPKIYVIQRTDLSYQRSKTITDLTSIYGISYDNNTVYGLGILNNNKVIFTLNLLDIISNNSSNINIITQICTISNISNSVPQGFCVYNGYAYCVYNRSNQIIKIDLNNGNIITKYNIPDGDSLWPVGEPENVFVQEGKIYLLGTPSLGNTYSSNRYVALSQIFATDLVGDYQDSSVLNYDKTADLLDMVVNSSATITFNPTTTVTTVEEACLALNYKRSGTIDLIALSQGYCALNNGKYFIKKNGSTDVYLTWADIYNANVTISQARIVNLACRYGSNVIIKACSGFQTIYTGWSNVCFERTSFAALNQWTNERSSLEIYIITNIIKDDATISASTNIVSNGIKILSYYQQNILKLLALTGVGSYNNALIKIYEQSATNEYIEPIELMVNINDVLSTTVAKTYTLPNHSKYTSVKFDTYNIYLNDGTAYSQLIVPDNNNAIVGHMVEMSIYRKG